MKSAMRRVQLSEVMEVERNGIDPSAMEPNCEYIGLDAMDSEGGISRGTTVASAQVKSTKFHFTSSHILFGKLRPYLRKVAAPDFNGICSTDIIPIRPKGNADRRYLLHWLRTDEIIHRATQESSGANLPRISPSILSSFEIPLPATLAEQKRLAAILDQADAIRRKRQQALRLTDDFLRSVFLDLFEENRFAPTTIQSLIDDTTLLYHKDGNHGGLYPRATEFGAEGIPFISAKHIDDDGELNLVRVPLLGFEKARSLRLGWLQPKDVLLAHNATVGPCAMYDGQFPEALIGTSLTAFRANPNKLLPEFLLAALRSAPFQKQLYAVMSQTTRNQVPITAQRTFVLSIPPLSMQADFARIAEVVNLTRRKELKALAEAEALFQSLQHHAFTGQL